VACCCSGLHGSALIRYLVSVAYPERIRGQTDTLKVWTFCNCVFALLLFILSYIFCRKTLTIVQIFHICFSFWGTLSPDLLPGLCPWTPLGGLHPPDPWLGPFWKKPGSTCEPLYFKILGSPTACAHAELENVLLRIMERPLNFTSKPRITLAAIASAKRSADAIARHSGYTVVIHNSGRYVFLWRPLNYTLPENKCSLFVYGHYALAT